MESDAARVCKNKVPTKHPDKSFPDTYLKFPHPSSHHCQDQVRYYLPQAGVDWEQALRALE